MARDGYLVQQMKEQVCDSRESSKYYYFVINDCSEMDT